MHLYYYQQYYKNLIDEFKNQIKKRAGLDSLRSDVFNFIFCISNIQSFDVEKLNIRKPRILVCAPSNAAIDEIIKRIEECGLLDGRLKRYNPEIARIGSIKSDSDISIERIVESYLRLTSDEVLNKKLNAMKEIQRLCEELKLIDETALKEIQRIGKSQPVTLSDQGKPEIDEYLESDELSKNLVNGVDSLNCQRLILERCEILLSGNGSRVFCNYNF